MSDEVLGFKCSFCSERVSTARAFELHTAGLPITCLECGSDGLAEAINSDERTDYSRFRDELKRRQEGIYDPLPPLALWPRKLLAAFNVSDEIDEKS